ncbi:MAG: hypothetical protein H6953_14980 [Chromatiaceae bacterium]|nr:hypothetical protein [Chromatiaceae bacterium]MCP5421752.1 hypothetical protein [Chromatiaceae bacterium]
MRAIGRTLGYLWAVLFIAFVGSKLFPPFLQALPDPLRSLLDGVESLVVGLLSSWVFLPLFLIGWLVVSYHLGKESGWVNLSKRFMAKQPFEGQYHSGSGKIGSINYKNSLYVSYSQEGVSLKVPILFRVGHPPLLIPWHEVASVQVSGALEGKRSKLLEFLSGLFSAPNGIITLKRNPEFALILPWSAQLNECVPSNVLKYNGP